MTKELDALERENTQLQQDLDTVDVVQGRLKDEIRSLVNGNNKLKEELAEINEKHSSVCRFLL